MMLISYEMLEKAESLCPNCRNMVTPELVETNHSEYMFKCSSCDYETEKSENKQAASNSWQLQAAMSIFVENKIRSITHDMNAEDKMIHTASFEIEFINILHEEGIEIIDSNNDMNDNPHLQSDDNIITE